jgi:hypothetical protein
MTPLIVGSCIQRVCTLATSLRTIRALWFSPHPYNARTVTPRLCNDLLAPSSRRLAAIATALGPAETGQELAHLPRQ